MIHSTDKITAKIAMLLITNISESTAKRYIKMAREHYHKKNYQILSVEEFRNYFGIVNNVS